MKVGRNLGKIRRALASAGKLGAGGLCRAGDHGRRPRRMRLADKPDDRAPYFSLVLVPGWEGRP